MSSDSESECLFAVSLMAKPSSEPPCNGIKKKRNQAQRRQNDEIVDRVLDTRFTDFSNHLRNKVNDAGQSLRLGIALVLWPPDEDGDEDEDGNEHRVSNEKVAKLRYKWAEGDIAEVMLRNTAENKAFLFLFMF